MQKLVGTLAVTLALSALPAAALAADHQDGPLATSDPAADITDVFAWTSPDGERVNLVLDVFPAADKHSRFSDAVDYVFHTTSRKAYGAKVGGALDIICRFGRHGRFECRAGGREAEGRVGRVRFDKHAAINVYAGLRDDPFFFNLDGFKHTAATVRAVKGGLKYDAAGCPALDAATSALLVNMLKTDPNGNAPVDHFDKLNVLAIVVSVDKRLLTRGGSLVSVWGSTHIRIDDGDDDGDDRRGRRLGPQIDRMGRAAINTAITDPFDLIKGETIDQAKDEYNEAAWPATWGKEFAGEFASTLAVLDALDGNCGNQLIAKPAVKGKVPADRYAPLAGVLADDQLYLDTRSRTCSLYLAVEADAVGLAPGNGDCGGRTPLENTVDESYSLLAIGKPSGVTNGITKDADHTASLSVFPFLQDPN